MILITGATGTNGREILKQLSAKGVRARAMVRKREDTKLPRTLNVEFVRGNFDDATSLDAALAGVSAVSEFCRASGTGSEFHSSGEASRNSARSKVFYSRRSPRFTFALHSQTRRSGTDAERFRHCIYSVAAALLYAKSALVLLITSN